jgi:hypothetical protein
LVNPEPFFHAIDRVTLFPDFTPITTLSEYKSFVLEKAISKKRVMVVFNTINMNDQLKFYN